MNDKALHNIALITDVRLTQYFDLYVPVYIIVNHIYWEKDLLNTSTKVTLLL